MADETDLHAKVRSFHLTQIRHLEEQVEACGLECKDLEEQNENLLRRCSMEKTSRDQFQPLRDDLAAREEEVEDLHEHLETLWRDSIQAKKARGRRQRQQRREMEELLVELKKRRDLQAAALDQQQQRLKDLRRQVSHLESLKKQLANQAAGSRAAIHSLTQRLDSERKKHAEDLQSQMEGQEKQGVSDVLKKELKKHKTSAMQLHFLEKDVPALQEESKDLEARMKQALTTRTDLMETRRPSIQERCDLKKEVDHLREIVHQLTAERNEISCSTQSSHSEIEDLCQRQTSADEKRHQQESNIRELEEELEREKTRRRQLEGGVQEAAIILRRILAERDEASQTLMTERLVEILESYPHPHPPRAEDQLPLQHGGVGSMFEVLKD